MRNYYSDYVGHMMRQYLKLKDSDIPEEIARHNVGICQKVISALPEAEKSLVTDFYSIKPSPENIEEVATSNGIRVRNLWVIVKNFEKEVATERGLI